MSVFLDLLQARSEKVKGIIHVGANRGEELESYIEGGASKVLWVEAEPNTFSILKERVSSTPGHTAVNAVVASVDDRTVRFNVSNGASQSSSIYEFALHAEIYPNVEFIEHLELKTKTIDTLVRESGLDSSEFNCLCLDIQGAEMEALLGASSLLPWLTCIQCEISADELYLGGAAAEQIASMLSVHGFEILDWVIGKDRYGDAVFYRKPPM